MDKDRELAGKVDALMGRHSTVPRPADAVDDRNVPVLTEVVNAPNWEPEPFFSSLKKVAQKTGQKVTIFAAGRMGGGGEAIWERLAPAYPDFRFQKLFGSLLL